MAALSLIVCTRNRAKSLALTLDSIEAAIKHSNKMDIEVVIVNNASTDNTGVMVQEWSATVPFPVLTPYEARKGLSHARNTGMSVASGTLLAFTDDDCRLAPDYFVALDRCYQKDDGPVMRGGRVELGDPDDLPIGIKLDSHVHHMTDIDHPGNFIIGANMIITRAVLNHVGFFDVRFGAGAAFVAAEETDYIYRCYLHNIRVEYVPDLVVFHCHGRKDQTSIARLNHGYHVGGGALYAKYFKSWHLLRHFYWDSRKWITSLWTGTLYNEQLGLSYWSVIAGNLHGMWLYAYAWIKQRLFLREQDNDKLSTHVAS